MNQVAISSINFESSELVKIGSNNIFAEQSRIFCHSIENGKIKLKPLVIGSNCLISCWGSIQGGVECGDQVELKPGAIPLPWFANILILLIIVGKILKLEPFG